MCYLFLYRYILHIYSIRSVGFYRKTHLDSKSPNLDDNEFESNSHSSKPQISADPKNRLIFHLKVGLSNRTHRMDPLRLRVRWDSVPFHFLLTNSSFLSLRVTFHWLMIMGERETPQLLASLPSPKQKYQYHVFQTHRSMSWTWCHGHVGHKCIFSTNHCARLGELSCATSLHLTVKYVVPFLASTIFT